jgi:hypothetical protein
MRILNWKRKFVFTPDFNYQYYIENFKPMLLVVLV